MFKDFIDLSVLKDAQPGFSSQSVGTGMITLVRNKKGPDQDQAKAVSTLGVLILRGWFRWLVRPLFELKLPHLLYQESISNMVLHLWDS